ILPQIPQVKQMAVENDSSVTEFILIGLTDQPELQLSLFVLLLVNYSATMMGNLSLMSLICLNSHLHIAIFVSENTISFTGCMTQLFFFCLFVNSECYVLKAMAYDGYVAICQPLLMFASHLMGLSFCDSNIINHYMCDTFPLFELSCGDTHANELVSSVSVAVVVVLFGHIILSSYILILVNIIHLSSAKGLSKAMSTCSSHIITVALFYGFGLLAHIKPSSAESVVQRKVFSAVYTFVLPLLNPLIYSLRNKDVKLAVKRTLKRLPR
uniref:G-protein coupled receptors family 1 profile domain-containing protein n=1 Tax=Nannospalax galili TaxID=1026970 RepID=A0A8C6QVE2_NANGA